LNIHTTHNFHYKGQSEWRKLVLEKEYFFLQSNRIERTPPCRYQMDHENTVVTLETKEKKEKSRFENVARGFLGGAGYVWNAVGKNPVSIGVPLAVAGIGISATCAGFGVAGIAANSIAAGIQSGIGNVAAGSTFATMQSLAASGTFSAMTTGGLATTAGSAAVIATKEMKKNNKDQKSNKSEVSNDNKAEQK
jgi:Interferon-induced 6-16 family